MVSEKGSNFDVAELEVQNPQFVVNRSFIPTVPEDDQNGELYQLGIDIYEQEAFEKGILDQVGAVLEIETENNDEDNVVIEITENELDKGNQNLKPNVQEKATDDTRNSNVNFDNCELPKSEVGRKVRMGEMTPFGTSVTFNTPETNCFGQVEEYLKDQIKADKKRKALKRKLPGGNDKLKAKRARTVHKKNLPRKKQPSKKEVVPQTNRKRQSKKRALGNHISEDVSRQSKKPRKTSAKATTRDESSDRSYVPSGGESSDSEEYRIPISKKRKKLRTVSEHPNGGNTDDSDWEYSDDEKSGKSKSAKKEQDDGDMGYYLKRLSTWEKQNDRVEIEKKVQNLDGGLKVPLFIWDRLFQYQKVGVQWLWELHNQRCGGILGDEMGLGKTVQVIALLAGLSISKLPTFHGFYTGLGPVLIVSPTTLLHQWIREIHYWWPQFRVALLHESGNYGGKRSCLIKDVVKRRGILVTSFVGCVQQKQYLTKYLWHYVILDEGHKIRNPESQITKAVKEFETPHRLILSGSPMQNNLKELWSLFDFVYPGKLGSLPVFTSKFSIPITQGGYANASKVQIATGFKCATILRDTISPYLLRRVKEDVKSHINLPLKNEQVLFCKLTEEQKNLYKEYLNSHEVHTILSGKYRIFVGLINLRKICNHPDLYTRGPNLLKKDDTASVSKKKHYGYWKKSGKMIVVETLLKIWKKQNHRVLIFTQSRQMLHILESFIQSHGYSYLKLDGTTTIRKRQPVVRQFNEDRSYFVFLSTTRVGGLGINLTGADRVVIYDPDWNPATDTQARERAWRIGQKNQVTIYRLLTSGTIEEKIYHRQIFKQFLTNKVLKNPRQRRLFKNNDLYDLFTFNDTDGATTETSALFAGSGSEVNLKSLSRRMKLKQKELASRAAELAKETDPSKILGQEKVEQMKQLAKMLSQKITNSTLTSRKDGDANRIQDVTNGLSDKNCNTFKINGETKRGNCEDVAKNGYADKKGEEYMKTNQNKSYQNFEGQHVPHLVSRLEHITDTNLKNEYQEEQDDYILGKLFSKSEIKTALRHDRIVDATPCDYVLVEGEAEKIAIEAVTALKESRKQSLKKDASSLERSRFSSNARNNFGRGNTNQNEGQDGCMTSRELLLRIRERNRLFNNTFDNIVIPGPNEDLDLLTDIRNFVSHEAQLNNQASTQEIVDRFRDRLPAGKSPVVKALLQKICDFYRDSYGKGIWSLKEEYRW